MSRRTGPSPKVRLPSLYGCGTWPTGGAWGGSPTADDSVDPLSRNLPRSAKSRARLCQGLPRILTGQVPDFRPLVFGCSRVSGIP